MLLNEEIVDIEKSDGICLLTFVVDEFSGLFLYPSIFCIIIQDLDKKQMVLDQIFDVD